MPVRFSLQVAPRPLACLPGYYRTALGLAANWLDARIMTSQSQTAMLAPVLLTAVAAGVALLALRRRRRIRRTDQLAARSRGCLLGAAVGDALGAGCEMMTRDGIAKVYGRVTAYIPEAEQKFGGGIKRIPGCYTDDMEMAIARPRSEPRGHARWRGHDPHRGAARTAVFALARLREWHHQGARGPRVGHGVASHLRPGVDAAELRAQGDVAGFQVQRVRRSPP